MAQQNRRQVSIRSVDWQKASELREEMSRASGRRVTITDTIARALGCLEGEPGQVWRNAGRAVEDTKQRNLEIDVVSLLSQFIARTMPERRLCQVRLEPGIGSDDIATIIVHLDDREVPLFMGRVVLSKRARYRFEQAVPSVQDFMPAGTGKPIAQDTNQLVSNNPVVSDKPLGSDDE